MNWSLLGICLMLSGTGALPRCEATTNEDPSRVVPITLADPDIIGIGCMVFGSDGKSLTIVEKWGYVYKWTLDSKKVSLIARSSWTAVATASPDSKFLITSDLYLVLHELFPNRRIWWKPTPCNGMPTGLVFSADNALIAIGNSHGVIAIVDRLTGDLRARFDLEDDYVTGLAFSGNAKTIFACTGSKIHAFNLSTKKLIFTKEMSDDCKLYSMALSPDKTQLFFGCQRVGPKVDPKSVGIPPDLAPFTTVREICGGEIHVWDIAQSKFVKKVHARRNAVTGFAIHPGKKFIASYSHDGSIALWRIADLKCIACFRNHNKVPRHLAIAPSGKRLAVCFHDHTIQVYEIGNLVGSALSGSKP
jgi:WD40 repeat protein